MAALKLTFVGFGEVASTFAAALVEAGTEVAAYDVLLDEPGGLGRLRARGGARCGAGSEAVTFAPLAEALEGAAYVLSTVTTPVAATAAEAAAAHLGPGQVYVDLNAAAPSVKREIEAIIRPSGAAFVEGAILGAVGVTGARTEILLGGPAGREAAELFAGRLGLNVRFYSEQVGKASTFKMLRSVFAKGFEALLLEFLISARRAGLQDDLWRDVTALFEENRFEQVAANWARSHAVAHERRYHEIVQVAGVLRELGLEPIVTAGTEAFYARSRGLGLAEAFPEKPETMDDVVAFMERALRDGGE